MPDIEKKANIEKYQQAGIFGIFTGLWNLIQLVLLMRELNSTYGQLAVSFENAPRGQFLKKIDIPIITVYMILEAKAGGQTLFCGYVEF